MIQPDEAGDEQVSPDFIRLNLFNEYKRERSYVYL